MEHEFYNVICKVCKQEYIINKSALNREMDGDNFYICPTCRLYGTEEKNNINPDHYGNSGIDVIDFCQANNLDFMQGMQARLYNEQKRLLYLPYLQIIWN